MGKKQNIKFNDLYPLIKKNKNILFDIDFFDFVIRKRKIIISLIIIVIWTIIGVNIANIIKGDVLDKNAEFTNALKIDTTEMFQYGMETNVGNAFVYGNYTILDPVSIEDIDGEYGYIEKVEEKYTQHTRRVRKYINVGKKVKYYYTTETYWDWDVIDNDYWSATKINFCGIDFDVSKINMPTTTCLKTIDGDYNTRYKYYVVDTNYVGTIYTSLENNTIENNSSFYLSDLNTTYENSLSNPNEATKFFWIVWMIICCFIIYGYVCLDNYYFE